MIKDNSFPSFKVHDLVKIIEFFINERVTYMLNYPEYFEDGETEIDFITHNNLAAGNTNHILCSGTATRIERNGNGAFSIDSVYVENFVNIDFAKYFDDAISTYGFAASIHGIDVSRHYY